MHTLHNESRPMFNSNQTFLLVQKLKSAPRVYTRSQGWTRKNLFNLPKITNKCWTLWPCIGPKSGKRIPSNLEGQFVTLVANVLTFINFLTSNFYYLFVTWGQTTRQKCSKLAPSFLGPDTLCKASLASWFSWPLVLFPQALLGPRG